MVKRDRPNVLLITTDEQRYDTLGVTGNPIVRTPHIDALANKGVLFTSAFTQNPVCIPARACIQTGRYTHQHGLRFQESAHIDTTPGLPPWERVFMERMQWAGYYTAAFGKLHMYPEKGFHEMQVTGGKGARWSKSGGDPHGLGPLGPQYAYWLEQKHPGAYEAIYKQRRQPEYRESGQAITFCLPLEEYVDYWIMENTVKFLTRPPQEPFFVWCGFCSPHSPYDTPAPYDTLYRPDDIALPANFNVNTDGSPRPTTPEEDLRRRNIIAHYWGLVSLIDDMVGRISDAMTKHGLWDNTMVIYATDHGCHMGDFGMGGKGTFYDIIIHVPLIAVLPDSYPKAPSRIDEMVETMDIAPTILDYTKTPIPDVMSATSLRLLLEGKGKGKELILCEFTNGTRTRDGKCLRTRRYKYNIHRGANPTEAFFDLEKDPLERKNVVDDPSYRDELARHRLLLIERLMSTEQPYLPYRTL